MRRISLERIVTPSVRALMMHASQIIDLDRYPISDINDVPTRALIDACRQDLDEFSLCTLPNFVRPEALPKLVAEARALTPKARRCDTLLTAYDWTCNKDFPPDHPRSQVFRHRNGCITMDLLPGDGPIKCMYGWDPLTDLVREALGCKTLYRCACPHHSIEVIVEDKGDELGWHYDFNDAVVTLLLQQPDNGGHFEYAPNIRDEDDEAYFQVARLFAGEPGIARRPIMAPGTFVLFKGRRSCHRVTPVGPTDRPRLITVFSYDEQPGKVFSDSSGYFA